jgi:hypothetical protein
MNSICASAQSGRVTTLNALDLPYACMPVLGDVDRIIDRHGKVLPDDWSGLCVTAVSTKDFWFIKIKNGRRLAAHVGRFHTVADAIAKIAA